MKEIKFGNLMIGDILYCKKSYMRGFKLYDGDIYTIRRLCNRNFTEIVDNSGYKVVIGNSFMKSHFNIVEFLNGGDEDYYEEYEEY